MAQSSKSPGTASMYNANLTSIPRPMSVLLSSYSGIDEDSQISHILNLRNQAYKHFPYPCLGRFRFLELELSSFPIYQSHIIPLLIKGSTFLDLGTCLGQDIRKLIFDVSQASSAPVPIDRIYGADLRSEFIDIGYSLFKDESKLPRSQFIAPADIFDNSPSDALAVLDGKTNILHVTAVFHLFDLEAQRAVARRCLKFLNRTGIPGDENQTQRRALICGAQVAHVNAGNFSRSNGSSRWWHNDTSWQTMWDGIVSEQEWKDVVQNVKVESTMKERGFETGQTSDDVEVEKQRKQEAGLVEEGFRWMVFSIWIDFV